MVDEKFREWLASLDEEERAYYEDEFYARGVDAYQFMDSKSFLKMADVLLDNGFEEGAARMLEQFSKTVEFWSSTVYELTGKEIYFDLDTSRWRDAETGRFVTDPYVFVHMNEDDFERAVIEKYQY